MSFNAPHETQMLGDEDKTSYSEHFHHTDGVSKDGPVSRTRSLQPPELVRAMTPEYRLAAEAKLRRKIDLRLLPMVVIMYIMNYLDRNNIAAAKLAGLNTDLGLTSVQFSTAVSILFVGYLLMQVPSNLFLNKIGKPGVYLPSAMVVWGAISALTATCSSFGGLIAIRFFLGFVEAAYFVSVIL
jgi:sugar phosphate permease